MYNRFALKVYNGDDWSWYSDYNNELRDPNLDIMTFDNEEEAIILKDQIKHKYTQIKVGIIQASWVERKINVNLEQSESSDIHIYIPEYLIEKLGWDVNKEFTWELGDENSISIKYS